MVAAGEARVPVHRSGGAWATGSTKGRRLTWSDEFDGAPGTPADSGTWQAETGGSGWGNQELQYYTGEPGNAALDGAGNLSIVVRQAGPGPARRRYGGCRYT